MNLLKETIARHKAGAAVGVYSVCSAHPLVLEAAIRQTLADGAYLLVEATSNQVEDEPRLVFEAHSTDYQTAAHLTELVEDHWAILKVGPGLTFALREALFALAHIEDEQLPADVRSNLAEVVDQVMLARPEYWAAYYPGTEDEQRIARHYSYSDRLRYYWPDPEVEAAAARLIANLSAIEIPLPLVSQYLPEQYARVRAGVLAATPHELAIDKVRDALRAYAVATETSESKKADYVHV